MTGQTLCRTYSNQESPLKKMIPDVDSESHKKNEITALVSLDCKWHLVAVP